MSNLAIVAIPDREDKTWKVSSEEIPHMTILYLSEINDPAKLVHLIEYVQHVCKVSFPYNFQLLVDRRDFLGDDNADVILLNSRSDDHIHEFRGLLLKDSVIQEAYNQEQQYQQWTPHLTLGYPDAPALPDPSEAYPGFSYVKFNKIGIWTGDFTGVEIPLKDRSFGLETTPLSQSDTDSFLEHYGVKGMKWGVRNNGRPEKIVLTRKKNQFTDNPKTIIAPSGGRNMPASKDAKSAARSAQKSKKSSVDALSNAELKSLIARLRLEQEYSTLRTAKAKRDMSRGKRFAKAVLKFGRTKEGRESAQVVKDQLSNVTAASRAAKAARVARTASTASKAVAVIL